MPYEAALNLPLFGRIASNLTYGLFSPLVEGRCGKGRKPPSYKIGKVSCMMLLKARFNGMKSSLMGFVFVRNVLVFRERTFKPFFSGDFQDGPS